MSANTTESTGPLATVFVVEGNDGAGAQLVSLREEFDAGFLVHATARFAPSAEQLRHVRDHIRNPSVVLSDAGERQYLSYVRRGGKLGSAIPAIPERRLPFTSLIDDDYQLAIVTEGVRRRVAIYFTLRERPSLRLGYLFIAPDRTDAKFAALYFKEDLESGRLRDRIEAPGSVPSAVRWLSR